MKAEINYAGCACIVNSTEARLLQERSLVTDLLEDGRQTGQRFILSCDNSKDAQTRREHSGTHYFTSDRLHYKISGGNFVELMREGELHLCFDTKESLYILLEG